MSTERTDITIQVSTKWEYDVIKKWMDLKKGPEAVADAMDNVGRKGKKAGTVMDTVTKGWESDFKGIVRGLTSVGLQFRALDTIIAGLRYAMTTFVEQMKTSQQGAATQMGASGATLPGMLRMAGGPRIAREMGMDTTQFVKHIESRQWGGLKPDAVNQMLQVVFSQLQGIQIPMALDAMEAMLTQDPTMTAGDVQGLMLAINPIINKGGALEGDPKAAAAFLLAAVQQSVIPDLLPFGLTAAPVLKKVTMMGTPEGRAARQQQLEAEWEAGGRQGPKPNAMLTDTARVLSGVVMGQGDAGDIMGRQVANAMLAAMNNLPRIHELTGYKGGYSDADRAHIEKVNRQGFEVLYQEIAGGESRAAQDVRMLYGDLGMIANLSLPGTDVPQGLEEAMARVTEALPGMDAETAATFEGYLKQANDKQQRYLELMSRTGGMQIASGEKGELKAALPIQRFFSDPKSAQSIFEKLPASAEEAQALFASEFGAQRKTPQGSYAAAKAETDRALAEYQSQNLPAAMANLIAEKITEGGAETRDLTAVPRALYWRVAAGDYDNTPEGAKQLADEAAKMFSDRAEYLAGTKTDYTPAGFFGTAMTRMSSYLGSPLPGVPLMPGAGVNRPATETELKQAELFRRFVAAIETLAKEQKTQSEEQKKHTELLRQANEPKEMTLQGGTGIRAPAQSKVPGGSPFNSATVVPYPTGYSDLEVDP